MDRRGVLRQMVGATGLLCAGGAVGKAPKTWSAPEDGETLTIEAKEGEDGEVVKVVRMAARKAHEENRGQVGVVRQALGDGFVAPGFWEGERRLWLNRVAIGHKESVVYARDNELVSEGYVRACQILGDVKGRQTVAMDVRLLDVLAAIQMHYAAYGWKLPLNVLSGYRSLKTNAGLEGAAKNSMHLYGRAADIYMSGVDLGHLKAVSRQLQAGGVGFYPGKGFVHVDTGAVRLWAG